MNYVNTEINIDIHFNFSSQPCFKENTVKTVSTVDTPSKIYTVTVNTLSKVLPIYKYIPCKIYISVQVRVRVRVYTHPDKPSYNIYEFKLLYMHQNC